MFCTAPCNWVRFWVNSASGTRTSASLEKVTNATLGCQRCGRRDRRAGRSKAELHRRLLAFLVEQKRVQLFGCLLLLGGRVTHDNEWIVMPEGAFARIDRHQRGSR